MAPEPKRVCVIGAGASGLAALKCCLDEGLNVICYEKTEDVGGLWNFRPNAPDVSSKEKKNFIKNFYHLTKILVAEKFKTKISFSFT